MAAPPSTTHHYDIVHNLGYKPTVLAYVFFNEYSLEGWRLIPAIYSYSTGGGGTSTATVYYEHIDDNTVRFYGPQDLVIKVQLYLEPRKDAWYE